MKELFMIPSKHSKMVILRATPTVIFKLDPPNAEGKLLLFLRDLQIYSNSSNTPQF
jgi:hypothetical protein